METRSRSLVKAVSWQLSGLVTMSIIGYAFTGSVTSGGALALASAGISFFTYLMHERLWAGVRWGKQAARDIVGRPSDGRDDSVAAA